ncbi:MAG: ferredoxin:protochlorophyllide reductase (ATP-dependent) subunit B, partial [Aquabacterium sp.]|nr:ferredoxin:protochlorophyllide reductase (ATP-dependent) subunit B [Aquabacterium sp.]
APAAAWPEPVAVLSTVTASAAPANGGAPGAAAGLPPASSWASEAELELKKIPFFVRGKARRNTERFAQERGLATITVETLYDAKAHFSR